MQKKTVLFQTAFLVGEFLLAGGSQAARPFF